MILRTSRPSGLSGALHEGVRRRGGGSHHLLEGDAYFLGAPLRLRRAAPERRRLRSRSASAAGKNRAARSSASVAVTRSSSARSLAASPADGATGEVEEDAGRSDDGVGVVRAAGFDAGADGDGDGDAVIRKDGGSRRRTGDGTRGDAPRVSSASSAAARADQLHFPSSRRDADAPGVAVRVRACRNGDSDSASFRALTMACTTASRSASSARCVGDGASRRYAGESENSGAASSARCDSSIARAPRGVPERPSEDGTERLGSSLLMISARRPRH